MVVEGWRPKRTCRRQEKLETGETRERRKRKRLASTVTVLTCASKIKDWLFVTYWLKRKSLISTYWQRSVFINILYVGKALMT